MSNDHKGEYVINGKCIKITEKPKLINPIKCRDCGKNLFCWYIDKPKSEHDIDVYHCLECVNCGLLVSCPKCENLSFDLYENDKAICEKCGFELYLSVKQKVEFS